MTLKNRSPNGLELKGPGRTRQDQADSCDINLIMKKYEKKGILPRINPSQPVYGDFSTGLSYHESLDKINRADEAFMALPADLRARCENDPAQLIAFCEDENNLDDLIEYGVTTPPEGWIHPSRREEKEKVTETSETSNETETE